MKVAIYANEREQSQQVKEQLMLKLQQEQIELNDQEPEIVLTIGGDGTVLHAVHHYLNQIEKVKFIGIHTGHLGYYTDWLPDELDELVEFLKAKGIKIGLASGSSAQSVKHHLNAVDMSDTFDAIAAGGDVKNGKPAPDIFLLTAQRLGLKPEDCFVFEDSANGIKAGFAAGMKCIGVPDMVPFDDDIKQLMLCELSSLSQAIPIFEKELK